MIRLLFPNRCVFCGRVQRSAAPCARCMRSVHELAGTVCRYCGADPANCICTAHPFSFRRNVTSFHYTGSVRTLVHRFKMRNCPQLADFMADRMAAQVEGRLRVAFSAVTYVPNAPLNALKRGYEPTRLLAEKLAARLGLPCVQALRRVRNTQQKYLTGAARRKNARESYRAAGKALHGNVLLVDDLITTGSTLNACAALLKQAGAEQVYTVTFAMAIKNKNYSGNFRESMI